MVGLESTTMLQPSDYERITLLNRTESPLLRLPAELRNHIYAFVFSNEVDKFAANVPQQLFRSRYAQTIGPAALLLTSRQTYAEINVLFFKTSTFDFRRIYWRKHALKAKNIARCDTIESILLKQSDLNDMESGFWQKQTSHSKFGALRRVHLRLFQPLDWMQEMHLEEDLRKVFGKSRLEVVYEAADELRDSRFGTIWGDRG